MGRLPDTTPALHDNGPTEQRSGALYVIATMADTTWRMFVPTIGLAWLGYALDGRFHTKPLLLLTGAAIGGVIAALLVRMQFKAGGKL